MFSSIFSPTLPVVGVWRFPGGRLTNEVLLLVLSAVLFIGISLLAAWLVCKVIRRNGYSCPKPAIILPLCGLFSLALFARFGPSVTLIQGLFLALVLLYASCSDLTTHEVGDFVWVIILALSLWNLSTGSLISMCIAALAVFLPQIVPALLPPHKTFGGADIKISTALAFLLGGLRGIIAYLVGLLIAILFVTIWGKIKRIPKKQPFALIPFLSVGAMVLFFL